MYSWNCPLLRHTYWETYSFLAFESERTERNQTRQRRRRPPKTALPGTLCLVSSLKMGSLNYQSSANTFGIWTKLYLSTWNTLSQLLVEFLCTRFLFASFLHRQANPIANSLEERLFRLYHHSQFFGIFVSEELLLGFTHWLAVAQLSAIAEAERNWALLWTLLIDTLSRRVSLSSGSSSVPPRCRHAMVFFERQRTRAHELRITTTWFSWLMSFCIPQCFRND